MKKLHTIDQIKQAVDAGHTVKSGASYTVIKGRHEYYIEFDHSDYCIGLHGMKGTEYEHKLNGSNFYIESENS